MKDNWDADLCINDLRHTVTVAGLNYEIWWNYKNDQMRPKYVEVMNRYHLFFSTSIHAHFVALLIALYRLYERRPDTYNIPSLLKRLKLESDFPATILHDLDLIHGEARKLWVKVNILRNKVFGHRSMMVSIDEAFKEAEVTPNELKRLVELTGELLNRLTLAW